MPDSKTPVSPTQIGYLRNAPSSKTQPRAVSGPLKGMLNKLAALGLVEIEEGPRYRRSQAGDESIAAFDAKLTPYHIETLRMAEAGEKGVNARKGANTLLKADLLYCRMSDGNFRINEHGRDFLRDAPSPAPAM